MKQSGGSKRSDIEQNIQDKQLRDAEVEKGQITAKLGAVKDAIKMFKNSKVITEAVSKAKVMTKAEREEYNAKQMEKDKQAQAMANRLREQQLATQRRKEENEAMKQQIEAEKEALRRE